MGTNVIFQVEKEKMNEKERNKEPRINKLCEDLAPICVLIMQVSAIYQLCIAEERNYIHPLIFPVEEDGMVVCVYAGRQADKQVAGE